MVSRALSYFLETWPTLRDMHRAYILTDMQPSNVANILGAFALRMSDEILTETADSESDASSIAALVHLSKYSGSSIEDLRAPLRLSHSGCVRVVDRLVSKKLIERRVAEDSRAVALLPTRKGRAVVEAALARREERLVRALQPLSKPEQELLADLMARVLTSEVQTVSSALRACRLCDYGACQECPVNL